MSDQLTIRNSKNILINDISSQHNLHQKYQQELLNILNVFRGCIYKSMKTLGNTHSTIMKIELTSDKPITHRLYRLPENDKII